jgi:hypothetical protein
MVLALSGGPTVAKIDPAALGVNASPSSTANVNAADATTATTNKNCDIIVPQHPETAAGLATPWLLTGPDGESPATSGCSESNPDLQAFVQATILDPATGGLWVYEPLVITEGTNPASAPVRPQLPKGAIVSIMVSFNGGSLRLVGAAAPTLKEARCVNGLDGSLFTQVAYCNSVAWG